MGFDSELNHKEPSYLPVVEAVVTLVDKGKQLALALRRRGGEAKANPRRATLRYVDSCSPNAKSNLQSRLPMIAHKCTYQGQTGETDIS